jgi:pimeloyl-ACP methyl ester carboxylesterase
MMSTVDLAYERRGGGPPLVLLHGIGHHWRAWEPVLDRLAEHHDVVAVDLPGFGRSPVPDKGVPPGMPGAVAAVARFFEAFGLNRPHVAGNSLGGAIALELAAAGEVASATALSPAGFATPWEIRRALATLRGHRLGAHVPIGVLRAYYRVGVARQLAFGMLVARPALLTQERMLADTLALRRGKAFNAVARGGRRYAFGGPVPTVPVTVAWGTKDRILPYRQAARAARLLPNARHLALDGCGHVPMSDDPDLVAQVILETCARPREGASLCQTDGR